MAWFRIKSCLKIANIKAKQIDKMVWAGKDPIFMDYFLTKRYSSYSNEDMINEQYSWWKKNYIKTLRLIT